MTALPFELAAAGGSLAAWLIALLRLRAARARRRYQECLRSIAELEWSLLGIGVPSRRQVEAALREPRPNWVDAWCESQRPPPPPPPTAGELRRASRYPLPTWDPDYQRPPRR